MDELSVFRGRSYAVNGKLSIRHPTLDEIERFGEQRYFGIVRSLCATPADRKVDIWDSLHVYWDTVDEYELFVSSFLSVQKEDLSILFGGLDTASFRVAVRQDVSQVILVNKDDVAIDRVIFKLMTDYLRSIHSMKKNTDVGANDETKDIMIEDDRDEIALQARKPFRSPLKPLISALTNCPEFKYRWDDVWTLPIGVFMDGLESVQRDKNHNFIMHGIYNGCVDIKKLSKRELSWIGDQK